MSHSSGRDRIVIFAKAPVAGQVKTRLIPALGAEGAAALAAAMLQQTAREALASAVGPVELCADPPVDDRRWRGLIPSGLDLTAQGEGDLGERLARAAQRVIEDGEHVLLIGSDCPDLDHAKLRSAAHSLDEFDAVIHPTLDGGYALLGLTRFDPSLFSGIAWSTGSVATATILRIKALRWSLRIGAPLRDIDVPADLT